MMTVDQVYLNLSLLQCVCLGLLFAGLSGAITAIVAFVWTFTAEVLS